MDFKSMLDKLKASLNAGDLPTASEIRNQLEHEMAEAGFPNLKTLPQSLPPGWKATVSATADGGARYEYGPVMVIINCTGGEFGTWAVMDVISGKALTLALVQELKDAFLGKDSRVFMELTPGVGLEYQVRLFFRLDADEIPLGD